jgi:hypothetical protein
VKQKIGPRRPRGSPTVIAPPWTSSRRQTILAHSMEQQAEQGDLVAPAREPVAHAVEQQALAPRVVTDAAEPRGDQHREPDQQDRKLGPST